MTDEQAHNKTDGFRAIYLALYLVGAVLSGGGGTYVWLRTTGPEIVAPDRFTGSQASTLITRVSHLEADVNMHLDRHPDVTNQFDRRIATLEAQYAIILANQARILDRLDGR